MHTHLPVIQAPLPLSTFADNNETLDIILAAPICKKLHREQEQHVRFGHQIQIVDMILATV